ncbi:MAG: HAD-IC family P-type ATPase [Patescibacteria group bacterium]|nr:HAD-IC family P-type ATPase [Patescibacteria group bacterium]
MKKFTQKPYYTMSSSASLLHLQSSENGLSDFEVSGRLKEFGKNVLPKQKGLSRTRLFFRQFNNPLIYIVMFAALASFFVGHMIDAIFIMIVVLINAVVGFMQESKAGEALKKLQDSVKQKVRVVRSGQKKKILAENIAIGDIVDLMSGDRITADGRIIEVADLQINESTLTGEWSDVVKKTNIIDEETIISDQNNMVFAGTSVTQGHGIYIVTATGIDTEIGKISNFVKNAEEPQTPLQKKFTYFSKIIGIIVFIAVVIFAALGIWRGESVQDVFITSTALVVSAIPEGLLPAITIVLIFGMRRLAKQKALVRKLNASETMGAITTICSDKTGTLTKGEMHVSHILTGANELFDFNGCIDDTCMGSDDLIGHVKAVTIGAIVNDAYIENPNDELSQVIVHGRSTDKALLLAGVQLGVDSEKFRRESPLIDQEIFNSEKKYAIRVHQISDDKVHIMMLGAPEQVLSRVSHIDVNDVRMPINSDEGLKLEQTFEKLTSRGLRVLACSERILTQDTFDRLDKGDIYNNMSLVGYIALNDPLRSDVEASLQKAEKAGIRLIVITGDHAVTARSVMEELGHNVAKQNIYIGTELNDLSDDEMRKIVKNAEIFARVLPEHKIRIVRALQANGEVVAMVGDGINDAPALKASDVGISVGNGTDIAKEVSDIVLLDSSFTTIIKSIEQGRVIYENIRRILIYLTADNFSALFLFFVAMLFGWPLPLLPLQILWINMIEDSFPNIALTTEYDSKGLMDEPPRNAKDPIISSVYKKFMIIVFLVSSFSAVFLFWILQHLTQDIDIARTATFVLIAFDSLMLVYVVRSFRRYAFRKDIFNNKYINIAVLISFVLLVATLYVPVLMKFLGTVPLETSIIVAIITITFIEMFIFEVSKGILFIHKKKTT